MNSFSLFSAMEISASGLSAQRIRMNVIARNIANAQTTHAPKGGPYRRKEVVFASILDDVGKEQGVRVMGTFTDPSPFNIVYDPAHPDADPQGYVKMPNVNVILEMIDMISATRAYEANITAFKSAQNMALKALEIARRY